MINKLLYGLFGRRILKVYFNSQSKKSGFENMLKSFVDSNGKTYYQPINDFDYPVQRAKDIHKRLKRIDSGLSDTELDRFIECIQKACNGGKNPDLAKIFFYLGEMKERKEIWIHEDLWFDVLALRYIREDEDPSIVDKEIHKQKIEQFMIDSQGGLYDFFYKMGVMKFIPYLEKLESDWDVYMAHSRMKIQGMKKMQEVYLSNTN